MVFFGNIFLNVLAVLVVVLILILVLFKRRYAYWRNLHVAYLEPTIPFGNMKEQISQKKSSMEYFREFYSLMRKRKVTHAGFYILYSRAYVPIDLELIKRIMQADFDHFINRGGYVNERDDPLSAQLFFLEHHAWKNLRGKLSATFTSGKMRNMFRIVAEIAQELIAVLQERCQNDEPVEAKDVSARFTTDVIGSCAFGIDCNSLKDPETEFRIQCKRLLNLSPKEMLSNSFSFVFPNLSRLLRLRLLPKGPTDFFTKVISDTVAYREENGVSRNDLMQLLLELKNKETEGTSTMTFNALAAQAFGFFFAGFETSSTLMSFALMELALNEDVQNTVRNEINTVLKGDRNNFTYDSLAELHYLDMVIHETLRKYSPAPIITRTCTKDYKVPNTDIIIPKGMSVLIPVSGIHYDPEYYPEPERFDPARFRDEIKGKRHQFAYLPFGEGPRVCLGLRFGMMQAKVGLVAVIKNFKVKINPRTETPIKLDPAKFFTTALGGLWIDLEKVV